MEKHINYMARTFEDYRSELLSLTKKYYPEIAESYNDSSIGSWFMDIMAGIGDNLSYNIDRMGQEQSIESANLRSSIYNVARSNGVKIPGPKASMCEVEISCTLPMVGDNTSDISSPCWDLAPVIKRSSIVSAGNINFQLDEDVDFSQQFNSNSYSNRTFSPLRNSNGQIYAYNVTKSVVAINGISRIYKRVISSNDLKPFMEIILPDLDVMNVESIIFKETSNFSHDPDVSDFFHDEEVYQISGEAVKTYRYFEVDCLAEQNRFGTVVKDNAEEYVDYTEGGGTSTASTRTTRFYKGVWKPVKQKFTTEFTDNGYMKITFGSGVEYDDTDQLYTDYAKWRASKIINNDMLGVLPDEGWTMYVLYRVGGGLDSNIAPNAINTFTMLISSFRDNDTTTGANAATLKGDVLNSLKVRNISPALAGKGMPDADEMKAIVKYNNLAQERCVTLKDYEARVQMMPPKYGSPYRVSVSEENNKIQLNLINIDKDGKLTKQIPELLAKNIKEYMSNYRTVTDYLEIRSGKIYNLGFTVDLFVSKNYNTSTVVTDAINKITEYMAVKSHQMGDDLFLGDLEREISSVDGVISLIDMGVYSVYGGSYSTDKAPFLSTDDLTECYISDQKFEPKDSTAECFRIDTTSVDSLLSCESNSIFEVKYPEDDIVVRVKLK